MKLTIQSAGMGKARKFAPIMRCIARSGQSANAASASVGGAANRDHYPTGLREPFGRLPVPLRFRRAKLRALSSGSEPATRVERNSVFLTRAEQHLNFSTHLHFHVQRSGSKDERSSRAVLMSLVFRDRVMQGKLIDALPARRERMAARSPAMTRHRWSYEAAPRELPVRETTSLLTATRRATLRGGRAQLNGPTAPLPASELAWPRAHRTDRTQTSQTTLPLAEHAFATVPTVATAVAIAKRRIPQRTNALTLRRAHRLDRDESLALPPTFDARRVELVMRKPSRAAALQADLIASASEPTHRPQFTQPKRASVAQSFPQEAPQPQLTQAPHSLPKLDASTVERLAEDVMRRIEKRSRIERERRGLS